jgi:hypothetical protein
LAIAVRRQIGDRRLDLAEQSGVEQPTLQFLAARFILALGMTSGGGIARVTRPALVDPLKQQARGLGHRVVHRGESAALDGFEDGAFQVFW